jgi:hypothetical protein
MDDYLNVLAAWMTIFSIALTVIAGVAYSRVRNTRVLLVTVAFALFAVQGVALTLSLMYEEWSDMYLPASVLLDTVIIVLMAMTVLKK